MKHPFEIFKNDDFPLLKKLLFLSLIKPHSKFIDDEFFSLLNYKENLNLFIQMVENNKLESVIVDAFRKNHKETILPTSWLDQQNHDTTKTKLIFEQLDHLSNIVEMNHTQWIILENAAIARTYFFEFPFLYNFGDLDLLINPNDLHIINKLLQIEGFLLESSGEIRVVFQKKLGKGINLRINLQTHLVARKWFQNSYGFDYEELLMNSRVLPSSKVRILNPEYFLAQLCIHSASHTYVRKPGIRLHMDVDWFLRKQAIDWDFFLKIITAHKIQTIAYWSLYIPFKLFGSPIPIGIFSQLKQCSLKEKIILRKIIPQGNYPLSGELSSFEVLFLNLLLNDNLQQIFEMIL